MFSYAIINDSRMVSSADLWVGEVKISLSGVDFGEYREYQRKTVVGVGVVGEGTKNFPSRSTNSVSISRQSYPLVVNEDATPVMFVQGERFSFENILIGTFAKSIDVVVYLDIPLKQSCAEEAPQHLVDSFEYSQVLHVLIMVKGAGEVQICPRDPGKSLIYEGYGQFGFFIADLVKLGAYIEGKYATARVNILEELTTTELASELFELGIFILVWGLTPWQYYIAALESGSDRKSLPLNSMPIYKGAYKFLAENSIVSIVPGTELASWPDCMFKKWPEIVLAGEGGTVEVELYVRRFNPVGGHYGAPMPIITLLRSNEDLPTSPLLFADINEAEAGAGVDFP